MHRETAARERHRKLNPARRQNGSSGPQRDARRLGLRNLLRFRYYLFCFALETASLWGACLCASHLLFQFHVRKSCTPSVIIAARQAARGKRHTQGNLSSRPAPGTSIWSTKVCDAMPTWNGCTVLWLRDLPGDTTRFFAPVKGCPQ